MDKFQKGNTEFTRLTNAHQVEITRMTNAHQAKITRLTDRHETDISDMMGAFQQQSENLSAADEENAKLKELRAHNRLLAADVQKMNFSSNTVLPIIQAQRRSQPNILFESNDQVAMKLINK